MGHGVCISGLWSRLSRMFQAEQSLRRFEFSDLEPRVLLSVVTPSGVFAEEPGLLDAIETSRPLWANVRKLDAGVQPIFPLSTIPELNSKPDAPAKIILDFDGDPSRDWGGFNVPETPAYDIDGDPTTFSQQELDNIQQIWSRVAEMFSPFNINVTTVDDGILQNRVSVKVVIGGGGEWLGVRAGGVAFLNSFTNSLPNVVYVFPENLGNGNPKFVSDASAHEAGHAFGLEHQSTYDDFGFRVEEYNTNFGSLVKAPIMGVSYNAARSLWWLGTSISPFTIQNDLTILTNTNNGFGYRSDDHGNTIATATALDSLEGAFSASGIIEQTSDVDMFSFFAGSGPFSIQASVASVGPMLDLWLEVLDGNGTSIATANTSSLGETVTGSFDEAGLYHLAVRSNGEFGDIGQYTINGTVVQPRVLQFSQAAYEMRENVGVAVFTVTRSDPGSETLTIDYVTSNGTALDGVDYAAQSGTLVFSPGQTSRTIEVPIFDNDVIDGDKTFTITLSNQTGGALLGQNNQAVVTILDTTSLVRFSALNYTVRESVGEATIRVTRSGSRLGDLSVDYATSDGTATAGQDYLPAGGTIVFAQGQMEATFTITVLAENFLDDIGTVLLTLSNPQGGVVLSNPHVSELRILDDRPPTIEEVQMEPTAVGMGIGAVSITFNKTMHPLRTSDPRSYSILAPYNFDGRLGMGRMFAVPLSSIQYDEATRTVTLVPRKPLPPNRFYILSVNGNIGPADRGENLLDGNGDGLPGGMYRVLFGRGNRLSYIDHDGSRVNLALFRGGVMELFRNFNGAGQTLSLHGTVEGWSVLRGHVVGAGRTTTLQDLTGDEGVINELQPSIIIATRV